MNPTFWIDGRHAIAAKGCRGAAIGARPSESSKKQPQHEDDRPLDTPPTSRQDHRSSAADAADVLVRHQQGVLPALAVFDVCEAARYAARCIRGAEQLTDGDFGAIAKRLPRTTPVLIYCYRGNASRTWAAMVAGHRVPLSRGQYSVDGGYEAFAAPLAAGHLALSAQWRDNEEALDLVHSDAPRRAAFVFTYGQAPGRYGVDLAFPEFAHIAAAGVPLVQEDLGLDQLLAVRACASIRRNRRRTHRGSRGRAGRVPRGGRTASVRSADPGCPRLTLSNDVAILRNGTPDVPSMPATSSSQDTPQVMTPTRPRVLAAVLVLALAGLSAGPARADAAAAGRYYEDGLARFARDDIAGAIIQLRNALQQDQAMLAAQLLLARALLRNGELGPAEVAFEEALRRGVSRAEVAVPLAGIYLAQGRPERLIERVPAGELPPALRVDVLSLRGTAYAQLGKHGEARASFDEARRLDPRSPVPLVAEIPVLLAAGEPVTARERARRAVELAPGSAAAWNARASVAQAAGELDAALADYARALDLQPDHLDARIARAAVLADLGRDGEAQVELDRLGPQAAGEPRGAYLRALLAGRRGDGPALADNLAAAARAIDALPPEWLAGQEQILMIGALVHHAQRQPQKARAHLETLIRRHPRNLGAPKLLARIELDANEPARTIALLGPVLRARPEDAQALYLMGSAYLAQKRYLQATDFLERAAARGGDPRTQASLALGQIGLGQGERGMENLAQAFARAPGDIGLGSYLVSFHLGRGDSGSAAEVAEALAAARPEHVVALNLLGVARAARGDSAGAREAYRAALARDGGFTPARLNLVRLDAAQGRHAEARAALEAILAKNRDHAAAMYEMGQLERLAGRPTEALRWLEKAYAAAPRDIQTARALVQALLEGGDRAAALDRAQALAARRVGDAGALEILGRAQLAFGNPQGAHQSFREMSRLAGVDAQAQVHVGYLQLGAGNPQDAAYAAHKILSGEPDEPGALILAAEAALAMGAADKAEEHVRRLRARHPQRVEGLRLAGDVALARRQFDAAADAFRRAQEQAPASPLALRHAQAYVEQARFDRAAAVLRGWLAGHADDLAARRALAEVLARARDWQGARAEYQALAARAPEDAGVFNNLANVLLELGDPEALAAAERAHALAPGQPAVLDTLAWVLARQGRTEEALRHLREARLRQADSAEIRYHLARVLADSGRTEEARAEMRALLGERSASALPAEARALARELGP